MTDAKAGYTGLIAKYRHVILNSIALADSMGLVHDGKKLLKLIQQPDTSHAYSYHSNEIISTLQSLLKKFKSEKSASSAALEEELNAHTTKLQQTEDAHAADQNFLNDLTEKCEKKAQDWDQRSSTRTQELTAIASALEMLKGDVSKMYPSTGLGLVAKKSTPSKTNPPAPKAGGHWEWVPDAVQVQAKKEQQESTADDSDDDSDDDADDDDSDDEPVSFLQLNRPQNVEARKKVLGFLAGKATALKSTILSTLLVKIKETPSPFAKVKQMIQDLVSRLEAEAEAEADQKSWCDENMKETTAERDTAQRHIEDLNALHMEKNALVDSLTG